MCLELPKCRVQNHPSPCSCGKSTFSLTRGNSGKGAHHWELATWDKSVLCPNLSICNPFFMCWVWQGKEKEAEALSCPLLLSGPSPPSFTLKGYWGTNSKTSGTHGGKYAATPTVSTEDAGEAGPGRKLLSWTFRQPWPDMEGFTTENIF